jgi:hypothetical protein
MSDAPERNWLVLMRMHREICFEHGDHPDEVTTPYSEGADAIKRLAAITAKEVNLAEELEAKLAKAVGALEFYQSAINLRIDCEITYAMQEAHDNAETFLAELKGEDRG